MNDDDPYARMRDYLEEGTAQAERNKLNGIPTEIDGIMLRSRLEAGWATTLTRYGITWEYEPELATLDDGRHYLPDFRLPALATVIEAKGPHMQRLDKVRDYARQHPEAIVLVGFAPQSRALVDWRWEPYMQWRDALGYNSLLTECPACKAYQWCRPRFSMRCRKCTALLDGHFAGCGEMRFYEWQDHAEAFDLLAPLNGGSR